MGFRRAAKKDLNQTSIVDEIRGYGYDVDIVHQLKKLYDIIVSAQGKGLRVEIKQPGESLSPDEETYWKKQKHSTNLIIAECSGDILKWFQDDANLETHKQLCETCSG